MVNNLDFLAHEIVSFSIQKTGIFMVKKLDFLAHENVSF